MPSGPNVRPLAISPSSLSAAAAVVHRLNGALNNCSLSLEMLENRRGYRPLDEAQTGAMTRAAVNGLDQAAVLIELLRAIVLPEHATGASNRYLAEAAEILTASASRRDIGFDAGVSQPGPRYDARTAAQALVDGLAALERAVAGDVLEMTLDPPDAPSAHARFAIRAAANRASR